MTRFRFFAALVPGLLLPGAGALAQVERPPIRDISAVRIANYNMPSTVIQDRARVNTIAAELRQLRGKAWRPAEPKLSCYATLVLLKGEKTLTQFRVGAEHVVERAPGKGQSTYSVVVDQADLPGIRALLAEIPPAKGCQ